MYILYFDCTMNCVNGCYGYYTWIMTAPHELHVHVHVLYNLFSPMNGGMEISMISIFILIIFTLVKTFKSIHRVLSTGGVGEKLLPLTQYLPPKKHNYRLIIIHVFVSFLI